MSIMKIAKHIAIYLAVLGIGIWIFCASHDSYCVAGSHLTPASVHVSGYYRRDGTYVHEYYRRPPGGVPHDAPYESTQSRCRFFMVVGGVVSLFGGFGVFSSIRVCILNSRQKSLYTKADKDTTSKTRPK